MKTAIVAISAATLVGCATTTATIYDPVEYGNFVQVWTAAELIKTKCQYPAEVKLLALQLKAHSWYSWNYTIPGADSEVSASAKLVFDNVKELSDKYMNELNTPGKNYCELKTALIATQSRRIAETVKRKQ
jgi:hypothetical protein